MSRRSKAMDAGIHLALSLLDIRNPDGTSSPETNDWHRREAERLAAELNDEMQERDVKSVLRAIQKEERAERWARIFAKMGITQ